VDDARQHREGGDGDGSAEEQRAFIAQPSRPPSTNGVTMPAADTATELLKCFLTMSTRNSMPTTNM
jgi:hypothetical protein